MIKSTLKYVSNELRDFLLDNSLDCVFNELAKSTDSKNYFGFSSSDKSKISYLKGDRIPMDVDLIWDDTYREGKAYHSKIGKLLSDKIDNTIIQKISALLFARKESKTLSLKLITNISYYYHENNYSNESGSLGNSCMRYSNLQDAVKFYDSISPKHCHLLVLTDSEDKTMARALLWHNVEVEGKKVDYMDRIYTNNENLKELFLDYAKNNGIEYQYSNGYDNSNLKININIPENTPMPYMDSFSGYCFDGYLTNRSSDISLDSTEGNELQNRISCHDCGCHYNDDEIYYSQYLEDYLCNNCGIYIEDDIYPESECIRINGEYYLKESDKIIYSDYENDYILLDDSCYSEHENEHFTSGNEDFVYSEFMEDYILTENSIFSEYYKDYFLKDSMNYSSIDDEYYKLEDSIYSKWHNDYLLKDNAIFLESENDWFLEDSEVIYFDDILQVYKHKQLSIAL